MKKCPITLIATTHLTITLLSGQAESVSFQGAEIKKFEVASVKPHKGGPGRAARGNGPWTINTEPRRLTLTNATLPTLIHYGFGLPGTAGNDRRIVGLPDWASVETYDLQAVADSEVDRASLMAMLGALLMERFGLKFHWETRETPVYFLVIGKSGAKFRPWIEGEAASGMKKMSIDTLTHMLASSETTDHGPISDRTGLVGYYDLSALSKPRPAGGERYGTLMDEWLSRLPQDLGLELRREKGTGQFFCVDGVQRVPTEN